MRVLEQDQDWLALGKTGKSTEQQRESPILALLRAEIRVWIVFVGDDPHHVGKKCNIPWRKIL